MTSDDIDSKRGVFGLYIHLILIACFDKQKRMNKKQNAPKLGLENQKMAPNEYFCQNFGLQKLQI